MDSDSNMLIKREALTPNSNPSTPSSVVSTSMKEAVNEIIEFKTPIQPVKKKRIVLEEDKYAVHLEKIIERDYFPDLEKLNAQNAYLNALATNDIHMLRELYSKYSFGKKTPKTNSTLNTPSTFETPLDLQPKSTPIPNKPSQSETPTHLPMEEPKEESNLSTIKKKDVNDPSNMNLNDYLNKYTSEDNQSFQDFMEEAERKHRVKYSWLFDTEKESAQKQITSTEVPSIQEQAKVYKRPLNIETWSYKARNQVMYVPDGVPLTAEEEIELAKKKAGVVFANTRFTKTPYKEEKSSGAQNGTDSKNMLKSSEGKLGVDGKEVDSATPKVNGYSYMRTPSPNPGSVEDSPFMTWGEIEGTPFRLDGGDTPIPTATAAKPYKIFDQSKREKLAIELAEKVSHRYRDKKLKAIQAATSSLLTPSPASLKRGTDKLEYMTPAAQKFAKSHFGSKIAPSDQALRNSYTPNRSATRTPSSSRSSNATPSSYSTPSSSSRTPSSRIRRPPTVTTDDLLKLPTHSKSSVSSRPKASDFF